jgi:hypothetical protein
MLLIETEQQCPLEKLSLFRSMARGVSSLAGEDKDTSPLTTAAFLKNCRTKLPQKIDFRP